MTPLPEIIRNLKTNADSILSYIALNGLVANAKKIVFMILDMTKSECESKIAGNIIIDNVSVERSKSTKLLGVTIDEKHNWKKHFSGSDGLINIHTGVCRF